MHVLQETSMLTLNRDDGVLQAGTLRPCVGCWGGGGLCGERGPLGQYSRKWKSDETEDKAGHSQGSHVPWQHCHVDGGRPLLQLPRRASGMHLFREETKNPCKYTTSLSLFLALSSFFSFYENFIEVFILCSSHTHVY